MKTIPVVLITGFFGSGKTTLLHQLISKHRGGPLGYVLMDATSFAFDAGVVRGLSSALGRAQDRILEMQTNQLDWEEKLEKELSQLGLEHPLERLFIETSAVINIDKIIGIFQKEKFQSHFQIEKIVTVIDSLRCWRETVAPLQTDKKYPPATEVGKLIAEEIKQGSTFIFNKTDLISSEQKQKCLDYIHLENPSAQIFEAKFGGVSGDWSSGTSILPSNFQATSSLRQELAPQLETRLYEARRPFHPQRFWDVYFNAWGDVVRTKGFFWLATRMTLVGGLSQAGAAYSIGVAGQWWAAVPEEGWPPSVYARDRIKKNWKEPYGDRRQELILVGTAEVTQKVADELQTCLLTDEELAQGAPAWSEFTDPFPTWKLEAAEEEEELE